MELKTDTGVWGAWVFFTGKEKKSTQHTIVFNSGGQKKKKIRYDTCKPKERELRTKIIKINMFARAMLFTVNMPAFTITMPSLSIYTLSELKLARKHPNIQLGGQKPAINQTCN